MTTETKTSDTKETDKAVFGPLGKYAVIAVIMVSIIVTTAIMLDKQLNNAEDELAALRNEVTESTNLESASVATETSESTSSEPATEEVAIDVTTQTSVAEVSITAEQEVVVAAEQVLAQAVTMQTALTQPASTQEAASQEVVSQEVIVQATDVKTETVSASQFSMEDQKQQRAANREARIEAFKVEQKQRMADMFARIKALEAQQLDQYKVNQEKQIVRLRDQVSRQQEMIEALVLRNKDLFELRSANVQRIQTNREEVLNRI